MNPAPPSGWVRVLVKVAHRGDIEGPMDRLGGVWNNALRAWVVEPGVSMHLGRNAAGALVPVMDPSQRLRVELALRDLRGHLSIEWQVGGPSALPRRREDIQPTARTNRGWTTPKWEDPR